MATLAHKQVKVDRLKLIAALEAAVKRGDVVYKQRLRAYDAARAAADREIVAKVRAIAKSPTSAKIEYGYRGSSASLTLVSSTKQLEKPRDVLCDLRNTIAVLRLSSETNVTVSAEQYGAYFPCEVD